MDAVTIPTRKTATRRKLFTRFEQEKFRIFLWALSIWTGHLVEDVDRDRNERTEFYVAGAFGKLDGEMAYTWNKNYFLWIRNVFWIKNPG